MAGDSTSATHAFASAGSYTISAAASDDAPATYASNSRAVTVAVFAPSLSASGAAAVTEGTAYVIQLAASGLGIDSLTSWTIDWGDGHIDVLNGSATSASHAFAAAGNVTVSVSALDGAASYAAAPLAVSVTALPPIAVAAAAGISSAGTSPLSISVTYSDELGIAAASLDSADIVVVDPTGHVLPVVLTGVDASGDGSPRIATYQLAALSSGWNYTHNGTYSIQAVAHQVSSTDFQWVAGGTIGSFAVSVPPAPVASLAAPNVIKGAKGAYKFKVTYTDAVSINARSLGGSDLLVSGPNGFSQFAKLASVSSHHNGTIRTATYSIVPPSKRWTSSANGTYVVSLLSGQVLDVNGGAAAAGVLGSFGVSVAGTAVKSASALVAPPPTQSAWTFPVKLGNGA